MKNKVVEFFCIFLLVLPLIDAVSININTPDYIIEGESININFSINTGSSFNGNAYFTYADINSSILSVNFTNSSFTGEYYNYSWSIKGILPGIYSIFANLTNSSGITLATLNKTGTVNSSMPKIISALPSGIVNKDTAILIVKTDEIATCRYDATNNTYGNLSSTFSNTGSTSHNQTLSGLSQGGYTYYVRCQDANGYTMNESAIIKFTVDLPPSAQILLSHSSPVKAGTIEITVIASENLENAPTLEYSFNDAPSTRKQISLTGSNSVWKGYLIITELDDNKIGTFYFTAADSVGNVGTKIASGNIFVVDTKKPVAPQSVKAVSEPDGSIRLSWYYDGEEADYFNIYRATSSGINYVDFYAKSNGSTQFIDSSTIDKVTYYYKLSTVDKAGNEGPLSDEVFATSINKAVTSSSTAQKEESIPKLLPPALVPRVDTFVKRIDSLLIDVKDASNQLEEKQGEKRDLVKELKLIEQVNQTNLKLESLKEQLEGFKSSYATEEELEQKLKLVDMDIKKIEKITPKNIEILEKSEFLQSTGKEDIDKAVNELFKDISFTQDEKNGYIQKNEKEKDNVKVDVHVKVVSILSLDSTKSEKSIIKKKLSYQAPETLNDVIVIETIPKTIANKVDEIEFSQKYDVLKDDPVIKIGFLKFNSEGEEVSYSLDKKINVEEVKNTKTVVLLSLNELTKSAGKATGYSIFSLGSIGLSKTQALFIWLGILLIILLIGYYILFVRDYRYLLKKLGRRIRMKRVEQSLNREREDLPELPDLPSKNLPFTNDLQASNEDANNLLNELNLHINDVKADLADKLLPLFVMLNNKLKSKDFINKIKSSNDNNILLANTLIDQAHQYLDNNLHSEAVKLYPKISFMYQNLPKESRAEIYERCSELHTRIHNHEPFFRY